MNERYWDIKNSGSVKISSGFRVWEKASDSRPEWQGDAAEELTYAFQDFGLEEPANEVIVPDDDELNANTGSGAAALAASAAAALAALLMV